MNPYLEHPHVWQDFHESFMPALRDAIYVHLPTDYIVKIEEFIYVHELDHREPVGRPDLGIVERPTNRVVETGTATFAAPAHVTIPMIDEERLSFLEIRDRRNWQLIAVVELLSPSNKYAGPDREQHLAKRQRLLHSAAHLVEIDLLRGSPRLPLRDLPVCDYFVMVSRTAERPRAAIWPIRLREQLPTVPLPLRGAAETCSVDLQQVLHRVYDMAFYGRWIYTMEPEPGLRPEDAEWARGLIPS